MVAGVQTVVTLRIDAFLMFSVLVLSALPQRDPRGHYSAPVSGRPLWTLQIYVTGFRDGHGTAGRSREWYCPHLRFRRHRRL